MGTKFLMFPWLKLAVKASSLKNWKHALLENQADIAVHSMKDVPMEFPEGLGLAIICERETPTDAFVSNQYNNLDELPEGFSGRHIQPKT